MGRSILDEIVFDRQDLVDRCRHWLGVFVFLDGSLVVQHVVQWPDCYVSLGDTFSLKKQKRKRWCVSIRIIKLASFVNDYNRMKMEINNTYGTRVFGWPGVSLQIHGDVSVFEVFAAGFDDCHVGNAIVTDFKVKCSLLQLTACIRRGNLERHVVRITSLELGVVSDKVNAAHLARHGGVPTPIVRVKEFHAAK